MILWIMIPIRSRVLAYFPTRLNYFLGQMLVYSGLKNGTNVPTHFGILELPLIYTIQDEPSINRVAILMFSTPPVELSGILFMIVK